MKVVLGKTADDEYSVYDSFTWKTETLTATELRALEDVVGVSADEITCYQSYNEYLLCRELLNHFEDSGVSYVVTSTDTYGDVALLKRISSEAMEMHSYQSGVLRLCDFAEHLAENVVWPYTIAGLECIDCRGVWNATFNYAVVSKISHDENMRTYGSLKHLYLPECSFEIGQSEFQLSPLEEIHRGVLCDASVKRKQSKISAYAFAKCYNLRKADLSGYEILGLPFAMFRDCEALETVVLPDSLLYIANSVFTGCKSLKHIVIPDKVTDIGQSAFKNCTGLVSITLPAKLNSILTGCFSGCSSLEELDLSRLKTLTDTTLLQGCTGLKKCILSPDLSSLSVDIFNDCRNLAEVEIPDTVFPDSIRLADMSEDAPVLVFHRSLAEDLNLEECAKSYKLQYRVID